MASKEKPLEVANLFEVKQENKELIKQFMCRFRGNGADCAAK